ncbi:MAG: putative Small nuclear ribonucleoprotein Sm D3 [Streblomastix strix]|uniref:Small nuclear ribonucleoprotein Sm D3 n=1 Tax=Streblomastix strix TaxID=222440 RepID=A0A5J4VFC6_9EUKA|nr:MAG: putative Small nuclear ribonucleoprotein Sm D3 [Streblomastix strix]
MSIGVPVKLLHEAEGHIVTIEVKTHEIYRGKLVEAEDNFNCRLESTTLTQRDGSTQMLENVYIRGSQIRFVIMPEMLRNAPMFKRLENKDKRGKGIGMGAGRTESSRGRGAPQRSAAAPRGARGVTRGTYRGK